MNKYVNSKVGVVILTYNRLNYLKITIDKVLNQTTTIEEILVVDNNSNDGTKEYLETVSEVSKLFLSDNLGPAGGFHYGIKYFDKKKNVDFVWVMDDDFFPLKSCLEELLKHANHSSIVSPYVRDKDFRMMFNPSWSGVLISSQIIDKVGYPNKELFFWKEDSRYLHGIIRDKHGFPNRWVPSAKGVHFVSRKSNYRSPWRYYYEIRNTTYLRLYNNEVSFVNYYRLFLNASKLFGSIILSKDNRTKKLKYFVYGIYHGIIKKLGKTVDPNLGFIKKNRITL